MLVMSDGEVLTGLHFIDSRNVSKNCRDCAECDLPVFRETRRWLDEYFGGREPDFTPAYRIDELTPFRKDVIGANGALVGYGGGIENKAALLGHERWRGDEMYGIISPKRKEDGR